MTNKKLWILWGVLYALTALLGFIAEPSEFAKAVMVMLSVGFFVPGGILLHRGICQKDRALVSWVRNISLASLVLTLIVLVLNFLSVGASRAAGDVLYGLLILVSAPMVCGRYWVVSLFLWACLLVTAQSKLPKRSS